MHCLLCISKMSTQASLCLVHDSQPHESATWFQPLWISPFICIHLWLPDRFTFPSKASWAAHRQLEGSVTSARLFSLQFSDYLSTHCISVCSLFLAAASRQCGSCSESWNAGELSCQRRKEGGDRIRRGGFFLQWGHGWWRSQSGSWARGRRAPGLPLPLSTHVHINTHLAGDRAELMEAKRCHLVFISAHYTTVNLSIQIAPSLSTHHTQQPALHKALVDHFSGLSHVKSPSKIYPITGWEMEVISNTLQLASSASICADTADSTAILSHLEEGFDVYNWTEWVRNFAQQLSRQQDDGYCDKSASFPPLVWVKEPTLCGFVPRCEKYLASLSPSLQRGFRECDIAPKLCRGTIGPQSVCDTSLWEQLLFL